MDLPGQSRKALTQRKCPLSEGVPDPRLKTVPETE